MDQAERQPPTPLRLTSGFELLDRWAERASQVEKNIVHQALFAIVDRSVFRDYVIVDDVTRTAEFFVLARCELTLKVRVHDFETCGILYVGPTCGAPGLDQAAPEPGPVEARPGEDESMPGREEGASHWS